MSSSAHGSVIDAMIENLSNYICPIIHQSDRVGEDYVWCTHIQHYRIVSYRDMVITYVYS